MILDIFFQKFLKKYGEMVPPLEILRKELALFAQSTVAFCCRIPGTGELKYWPGIH